jgi:hypothetical protein
MLWKFSAPLALLLAAVPAVAAAPVFNAPKKTAVHHGAPGVLNASYTAVVNSAGTLIRGSGATSAAQVEGTGTYEVDFVTDVTACAYVATIGQPGSKGSQPAGLITVVGRSGDPNGVFVQTYTRGGKLKFLPFHIDVGC